MGSLRRRRLGSRFVKASRREGTTAYAEALCDKVRTLFVTRLLYNVKLSEIYNLLREFPSYEPSHLWSPNMSSKVLVGVFSRESFYLLSVVILMLWHFLFLYFGLAIWFCCVFGSPIVMHPLNVRFLVLAGVFYDIISIEIMLCITICVHYNVE